jgi:hypothetical protein
MTELEPALDDLIERFGQGQWVAEVARARPEYEGRTGRVYEDDEIYEARTVAFLEWYVCERPLADAGVPPAVLALDDGADARRGAWRAWATSHRSLFVVDGLEAGRIVLGDLWGGARFVIHERRRLHGVARGDVVEARLIGWYDRIRFGRTFTFHPATVRAAIAQHLRRARAAGATRADAVDHVAALQVRALRYAHVAPARVYAEGLRG